MAVLDDASVPAKPQDPSKQVESLALTRRHSAPNLLRSPVPLAGDRRFGEGVRFWSLEGEDISEDGSVPESFCSYGSRSEFIRDALHVGFNVDELIRAETILSNNLPSPKFGSVDCGAGQVKHLRPLASRIT